MTRLFPGRFFWYFLILSIVLVSGIATVVVQSAFQTPSSGPFNKTELQEHYDYHVTFVMPFLEKAYLRLLLTNSGVALFILLVPLFWVWIWWFRRDMIDPVILMMQVSVGVLVWALGHNSFTRLFTLYRTLPADVTLTMYLPHGIPEMLAFILAGTFSLLCIDALKKFLEEKKDCPGFHPGEISLFVFGRVWFWFILVVVLIAAAAAIECRVTPVLVKEELETALQQMQA